jgi:O-antigen/teichoic acid export membrane protein
MVRVSSDTRTEAIGRLPGALVGSSLLFPALDGGEVWAALVIIAITVPLFAWVIVWSEMRRARETESKTESTPQLTEKLRALRLAYHGTLGVVFGLIAVLIAAAVGAGILLGSCIGLLILGPRLRRWEEEHQVSLYSEIGWFWWRRRAMWRTPIRHQL